MANYDKNLAHALENNLNVMLIGKHGVGKTAIVKKTFEEAGLNWAYFSASTMDPWVDFVGVPKEKIDPETGEAYLDLVRPRKMANDEVEAIFFDELNRSHKKVRNAIMELLQFKSINGKKFNNLKVIWAAINPDDDEETSYDVDKLDPAQLDRFEVHINVPYTPDLAYFRKTHGEMGELAVKWWKDLKKEAKEEVSPRRLDYAVNMVKSQGDVRYVLNSKVVNASEFIEYLTRGNPEEDLNNLLKASHEEVVNFFNDHNNLKRVRPDLVKNQVFLKSFAKYINEEELLLECKPTRRRNNLADYIAANPNEFPNLASTILGNKNAYARNVVSAYVRRETLFQEQEEAAKKNETNGQAVTLQPLRIIGKGVEFQFNSHRYSTEGLNIAITGQVDGLIREDLVKIIEAYGSNWSRSVTMKTDFLVTGSSCGQAKLNEAQNKGIKVMNEAEFKKIYRVESNTDPRISAAGVQVLCRNQRTVEPTLLEINGQLWSPDELDCDTILRKTGRVWRASNEQLEKISAGQITREEAFTEWKQSL